MPTQTTKYILLENYFVSWNWTKNFILLVALRTMTVQHVYSRAYFEKQQYHNIAISRHFQHISVLNMTFPLHSVRTFVFSFCHHSGMITSNNSPVSRVSQFAYRLIASAYGSSQLRSIKPKSDELRLVRCLAGSPKVLYKYYGPYLASWVTPLHEFTVVGWSFG